MATKILSPAEAVKCVEHAIHQIPNLQVIGIAGPGEPLANIETFETLKILSARFPSLQRCLATNGLLLREKLPVLKKLGVRFVSVTVNATEPKVASKIYSCISYHGRMYFGVHGASLLIEQQFAGIKYAAENGLAVKLNTVLIPSINSGQIEAIAHQARACGAVVMNIMPLIPAHEFISLKPPTPEQLAAARRTAAKYIPQFTLCKRCSADAKGIPGHEGGCHG